MCMCDQLNGFQHGRPNWVKPVPAVPQGQLASFAAYLNLDSLVLSAMKEINRQIKSDTLLSKHL
jgi:hypothetical protein